jgi:hypothetical protein
MCWSVCLGLHKVHGHCDGCEAMHACAFLCVVVNEYMLTVISAR